MTSWLISFGWNWALLPAAAWLARRYWLATREPSLKYLQHTIVTTSKPYVFSKKDAGWFRAWHNHCDYTSLYKEEPPQSPSAGRGQRSVLIDVLRRERFFPWRRHTETWLYCSDDTATRESDGELADARLKTRLAGMFLVAEARRAETEELSK